MSNFKMPVLLYVPNIIGWTFYFILINTFPIHIISISSRFTFIGISSMKAYNPCKHYVDFRDRTVDFPLGNI